MTIERADSGDVVHVVTPMPIAEIDGEIVRRMEARLPAVTVAMDYGYPRNTHLMLEAEVRVQSWGVDEIRSGKDKGQMVRTHKLVLESIRIVGAYSHEQMDQGVGGSASATAVMKEEADARQREPEGPDGGHDGQPAGGVPGGEAGEGGADLDPGF